MTVAAFMTVFWGCFFFPMQPYAGCMFGLIFHEFISYFLLWPEATFWLIAGCECVRPAEPTHSSFSISSRPSHLDVTFSLFEVEDK